MEGVKGDGVKNLECEGWDVWEMKIVNKNCIAKECLNIILMSQIGHLALFKFSCLAEWLTELTRGIYERMSCNNIIHRMGYGSQVASP